MNLNEALEILKSNKYLIEKTSTEKYTDEDEYPEIDEEYFKLDKILKKELKRGQMSKQEYDFLYNRPDLLLDIIYSFMEKKQ